MTWFSSFDVSREHLARAVTFGRGTVRVNADEHPELDSRATVELYGVEKSEASLRRKTEKMGARFVGYRSGTWTFEVSDFSGGGSRNT